MCVFFIKEEPNDYSPDSTSPSVSSGYSQSDFRSNSSLCFFLHVVQIASNKKEQKNSFATWKDLLRFTTKLIKEAISSWKLYYKGYKSATRFIDDAQQRTIANELQKPNCDHLICYLFENDFLAAKYYQIRNRSFIVQNM